MKSGAITVRVPAAWAGRVTSAQVRRMLAGWFQRPKPLPEDPGAGDAYLRLSLPRRAVRTFAAAVDDEPSGALRRLIAANLALPTASPLARIPAAQVASKPAPRVEILSKPALPAAKRSASDSMDLACIACNGITRHELVGGRWLCVPCEERNRQLARQQMEIQRRLQAGWDWRAASNPVWAESKTGFEAWWRRYGLLVIAGLVVLAVAIVKLRRWLTARSASAAVKPVAVPVREGFMVWVPKQ